MLADNFNLPTCFSRCVQCAIDDKKLCVPENRAAFVREIVAYFEGILPKPSEEEYRKIAIKVCDTYATLKDKRAEEYWVRNVCVLPGS